jgi:hypothetical protein
MAFESSDGKKFTNRPPMMAHERGMKKLTPTAAPGQDDMGGGESPEDAVAQHGPAVEVTISHEGGKHSVKSRHEDGHEHSSEHGSVDEAHDAGRTLAGDSGPDMTSTDGEDFSEDM